MSAGVGDQPDLRATLGQPLEPEGIHRPVRTRREGLKVAWVHLMHLSPLPSDLGDILRRYPKIIVPELNLGQLCRLVRAEYLVDAKSISKVQGLPFTAIELEVAIAEALAS